MFKNLITLSCFAFLLVGCNKMGDSPKEANAGGEAIFANGLDREYILYLPESYDASIPTPMVLNFHGFGGQADEYMEYADMREVAEDEGFILVYPQGSLLDGFSHWNATLLGGDNKSSTDDFGFVEELIETISGDYNIDSKRIYACGYSNGGMMAYGLANHRSELVAAVASVSGTMLDFSEKTTHPMPILHLHGTSDGVIRYEGGSDFSSAQSVLDYWIEFNGTEETPSVESDRSGKPVIEHYVYAGGENGVSVEHYKYIDGDHVWFDATYKGKTTSELIWSFFSRYDLDGLR